MREKKFRNGRASGNVRRAPLEMQGRLNATMRFLVWGTIPIGSFVEGVLGTVLGLRTAIGTAAVGEHLPSCGLYSHQLDGLSRFPDTTITWPKNVQW
jgi:hypothetical protein